jgi:hypothetical protein
VATVTLPIDKALDANLDSWEFQNGCPGKAVIKLDHLIAGSATE